MRRCTQAVEWMGRWTRDDCMRVCAVVCAVVAGRGAVCAIVSATQRASGQRSGWAVQCRRGVFDSGGEWCVVHFVTGGQGD